MESLENIICNTIETLRSNKKQPNEDSIHNAIIKEKPSITIEQLKEQLTILLQKEKLLNKPHGGKNSYYIIRDDNNLCSETPHPPLHPPETPVRKARIHSASKQTPNVPYYEKDMDISKKLKQYVKQEQFETFFEMFLEFRNAVDDKLENLENLSETKKTLETKIKLLEYEVENLKKENKNLQDDSKSYLKIIDTLAEGRNIDAPWQTTTSRSTSYSPKYGKKKTGRTEKEIFKLTNKFQQLHHQQVNEENSQEEEVNSANIPNDPRRIHNDKNNLPRNQKQKRPQHCITENYIRNQKELPKRKLVVPGQRSYAETVSYGKKVLIIGDSHVRRINRHRINESFDHAKCILKSFSGARIQDLEHYIVPHLSDEKPDIAVIHIGSNNVTYNSLENNATDVAESIIQIGQKCANYGVKDVVISSIFIKESQKLGAFIRKINDELRILCIQHNFHYVSNDNIIRRFICGDGVHLTNSGTELFAGNVVNFLNDFILSVNSVNFDELD